MKRLVVVTMRQSGMDAVGRTCAPRKKNHFCSPRMSVSMSNRSGGRGTKTDGGVEIEYHAQLPSLPTYSTYAITISIGQGWWPGGADGALVRACRLSKYLAWVSCLRSQSAAFGQKFVCESRFELLSWDFWDFRTKYLDCSALDIQLGCTDGLVGLANHRWRVA